MGKNRPGMETEGLFLRIENRYTQDVGREQITGKLDTVEAHAKHAGNGMGEGGFTDAGQVFDQAMTRRQQTADGEADLMRFTHDNLFNFCNSAVYGLLHGGG